MGWMSRVKSVGYHARSAVPVLRPPQWVKMSSGSEGRV